MIEDAPCKEHVAFCGVFLAADVLVCLVKEEIFVERKIESISAYWVNDLVERCFLVARHGDNLNVLLAQCTSHGGIRQSSFQPSNQGEGLS